MERLFTLTTDSTVDMPLSYFSENDIQFTRLKFTIDGNTYFDADPEMSGKIFYDLVRSGKTSVTTQVNIEEFKDFFKAALEKGKDVLHLCFSSGLSGTCNSAIVAANELSEEYPERRVIVVDSLCASMGQGLLLDYAVALRDEGKTIDEVVEWLENNKLKLVHYFTVDDLNHLQRGGRISKLTAVFGGLLNVKPILHVDDAGKLVSVSKVRGRKNSLDELVNMVEKLQDGPQKKVFISHGDCQDEADYVANEVKRRLGVEVVMTNCIGPVIGGHAGPGTMAIFFIGTTR